MPYSDDRKRRLVFIFVASAFLVSAYAVVSLAFAYSGRKALASPQANAIRFFLFLICMTLIFAKAFRKLPVGNERIVEERRDP